MSLLADLAQLTRLRDQREKKAQLAYEKARQELHLAQIACEHQTSKFNQLHQKKMAYVRHFIQRCQAGPISMAMLNEHRLNLVFIDQDVGAAQFEMEQLQKAQAEAQSVASAAHTKLIEARKAIDKMAQAVQMAKTDLQREADQHTDRQEEEVLEAMMARR